MRMTRIIKVLKGRVLFVGIGNEMRGDDSAGPRFVKKGENKLKNCLFLNAQETPENYFGKILRKKPDTLIFVDAVDFCSEPGDYKIFSKEEIENSSISTHNSSLKLAIDYLESSTSKMKIYLLGFQPKSCKINEQINSEVDKGINNLIKKLKNKF